MVAVTFAQVVFRYALHQPLAWSEELARFLLVWCAMLAAAYGFKTRAHFSLVFLTNRCGTSARRAITCVIVAAQGVFLVLFVWKSLELIQDATTQIAPGTQLPMAVPYAAAPVGGVLMLYYLLRSGWAELRRPSDQ